MRSRLPIVAVTVFLVALFAWQAVRAEHPSASRPDIVIHAADLSQASLHGAWTLAADDTSADGIALRSWTDNLSGDERAAETLPLAAPDDYFDASFAASAGTPYRIWLRLKPRDVSSGPASIWVQFSDAQADGAAVYRIGSRNGLLVTAEACAGCGTFGWGWHGGSSSVYQAATITFAAAGFHTVRVQTRGRDVEIDQIVLSPDGYLVAPPGPPLDDVTVVRRRES